MEIVDRNLNLGNVRKEVADGSEEDDGPGRKPQRTSYLVSSAASTDLSSATPTRATSRPTLLVRKLASQARRGGLG